MAHHTQSGWLETAALALAAGVISSIFTRFLLSEPPPPESPTLATEAKLDRVIALLDESRRLVHKATQLSSGPATVAIDEPVRVAATPLETDARLGRLESAVERLTELLEHQPHALAMPIQRHAPINYNEIAALHALAQSDKEAAQRTTVFLTPQEVVRRFGFPNEIGPANGNDFYWTYGPPSGAEAGGMLLVFRSGYLAYHELR